MSESPRPAPVDELEAVEDPDVGPEGAGLRLHTLGNDDVEPAEGAGQTQDSVRTGVPAVDEVLAAVDGLEEIPLEEHLGVFEQAHDALRSALDADPDDPA